MKISKNRINIIPFCRKRLFSKNTIFTKFNTMTTPFYSNWFRLEILNFIPISFWILYTDQDTHCLEISTNIYLHATTQSTKFRVQYSNVLFKTFVWYIITSWKEIWSKILIRFIVENLWNNDEGICVSIWRNEQSLDLSKQ